MAENQRNEGNQPSEAELAEFARQMQEQVRSLTAAELLSQTGITLVNVAAARMGMVDGVPDDDLSEARAAIDALASLLPVLEEQAPGPLVDELRAGLAQLRMAYVELTGGGAQAAGAHGDDGEAGPGRGSGAEPGRGAGQAPPRARPEAPRPRIWTPGGDR
jgi:hypothetical protein